MLRLALCLCLAAPAFAAEGEYLFDTLKQHPAYKAAYARMTAGQPGMPDWALTARAVATPSTVLNLNGVEYEFHQICKPHDCGDNSMEVMFAPGGAAAWGLLRERGAKRFLGNPDAPKRIALEGALQG